MYYHNDYHATAQAGLPVEISLSINYAEPDHPQAP